MAEHELQETDNGRAVRAAKDDVVRIVLPENPTTGYSWEIDLPLDQRVLALEDDGYRRPETMEDGAGGMRIFRFRAARPGNVRLLLAYRQPWNATDEADKTMEFAVEVS